MNRSAVTTLLASAAILSAAPAASHAEIPLIDATDTSTPVQNDPMDVWSGSSNGGSVNTGTSGGLATTGSTGTGSFGLPNLDKMLFGNFNSLCSVTGSAFTALGHTGLGCTGIASPADAVPGTTTLPTGTGTIPG